MSESTFHATREDLRKAESKLSHKNDGNVPADSEVSQTKVGTLLPFLLPLLVPRNSPPQQTDPLNQILTHF